MTVSSPHSWRRVCFSVCVVVVCAVVHYLELARSGTDDQERAIDGRNVLARKRQKKKRKKVTKNIF
jgi:hypothetical protein